VCCTIRWRQRRLTTDDIDDKSHQGKSRNGGHLLLTNLRACLLQNTEILSKASSETITEMTAEMVAVFWNYSYASLTKPGT
jgi:hypothetical protein